MVLAEKVLASCVYIYLFDHYCHSSPIFVDFFFGGGGGGVAVLVTTATAADLALSNKMVSYEGGISADCCAPLYLTHVIYFILSGSFMSLSLVYLFFGFGGGGRGGGRFLTFLRH